MGAAGAALILSACTAITPSWAGSRLPLEALRGISEVDLERHVRALAANEFEGRAPGTRGEDLTVDYLVREFRRAGARPGNPDGTFIQEVPLIGIASVPSASFCIGAKCTAWVFNEDFVGGSLFLQPEVKVEESELVFVGYGLIEPELRRDDYKDADVRGKTVLMLASDPPRAPARGEPGAEPGESGGGFASRALSLAHKREAAVEKGAVARIVIRESDDPVGPLSTYSWSREELETAERRTHHLPVSLVAEEAKVRELLAARGHDLDVLKRRASAPDFRPVALGVTARITVRNDLRRFVSRNVVAKIEGSDPTLRKELVIHVAHWDHLGRDPSREGNPVFPGALDNASGVAALLEIARAYAHLREPPRRSVLFLATTGEEQGLLGAKHYVAHPLYPLDATVGVLNLDTLNPWGATRDFELVGTGSATFNRALIEVAASLGKVVTADGRPDLGFYFRSDQLEFARAGVPSAWIRRGSSYIGRSATYGRDRNAAYYANDYHQVTDTVKPDWDYSGMAEQVRFTFLSGYVLAMVPRDR